MKARLKVIKTDTSTEEYVHTKVMHTVSNALEAAGRPDIVMAENIADVVTYYFYKKHGETAVASDEILSVIKVALSATGYEDAAQALSDYDYKRKLLRNRIEVVRIDLEQACKPRAILSPNHTLQKSRWSKSVIVEDLIAHRSLDRHTARAVAAMVEQRIFSLGITQVAACLVKQLVLSSLADVLNAKRQLQSA